jgi:hypothetical protein
MTLSKVFNKKSLESKKIWSLLDSGDFTSVINILLKSEVPENDIGECLFSLGDQAITEGRANTAINIFIFLTEALEDKSESWPLFQKIGDLYTLISEHEKARENYGRLPVTLKNIRLCFETFIPSLDITGLLDLRDKTISRIPEINHSQIHSIVDEIIMMVAAKPEIFKFHLHLFNQNLKILESIPPFTSGLTLPHHDITSETSQSWKPSILKILDTIYLKQNDIWHKLSHNQPTDLTRTKLKAGGIIKVYCNSPESLFHFIDSIKTDRPEFIKYECRIIINFELLKSVLSVYDLSPLENCDFVIRFLDQNNLKSELTDLLLDRKLPFTNRVVYLSDGDHSFFSEQVIPILKECEQKMIQSVEKFEQQLVKLFPDSFHREVIEKIKKGQKLRILLYASRFTTYMQHSIRDIAEGFRQFGHETFIQIEDEDAGVGIRKDVSLKNIIDFNPDILFEINHFRYEYPWIPKNIPYITWIQDLMPHIMRIKDPSLITEHDYIFSFSQHWIDNFFKSHTIFKNKTIACLPITVSSNLYYPIPGCKKKYDITFVSHIPDPDLTFLPILNGIPVPEAKSNSALIFLKQLVAELNNASLVQLHQIQSNEEARKNFANKVCDESGIPPNEELYRLIEPRNDNYSVSRFSHHIFLLMKIKPILVLLNNKFDVIVFGKIGRKFPNSRKLHMEALKMGMSLTPLSICHV